MKETNWVIKLLIVLPVVLFAALAVWFAMDRLGRGGRDRAASQLAGTVTAGSTAAGKEETVLEDIKPDESSQAEAAQVDQGAEPETENPSADQSAAAESTELLVVDTSDPKSGEKPQTSDATAEKPDVGGQSDPVVHLLFAGDIYLSNHVTKAYDKAGGIQGVLDDGYQQEIGRADIFMANQEFPFSSRGTPAPDKEFTFRLPPQRVSMMKEMGIDLVTLANNHTLDYGADALVDTCATLDEAGIPYVGAGENLARARQLQTVEVRGKVIGFLAASYVYPDISWAAGVRSPGMLSGYAPEILLEEVKKAGEVCDYLVVYMHWGGEKEERPQARQTKLGKRLVDAGADLVVGCHPHVMQGIEYYKGKPIVYSLGNFVFGSSIPKTALLRVDVNPEQGSAVLSLVPGTSASGYTEMLTDPDKISQFYQYMEVISYQASIDESGVIHPDLTP